MTSWYNLSLLALFLMGTQRFLYKVSAERKCNTAWTTFSFMATVTLLATFLFAIFKPPIGNIEALVFVALLNSGSFVVGTVTHIEALKHIPTTIVYPVIRLNAVIVVLFSIIYFEDRLSVFQVVGIILAVTVLLILTSQGEGDEPFYKNRRRGLILVFVSLLSGSVASISSKFAALYTNKIGFMAVSYFLGTLFSFGLRKRLETREVSKNHKEAIMIGFLMGLINFAGYYTFLEALSKGPLSIIVSITGMHFVIAVLLSVLIYKETLTPLRIVGVFLTITSVILLRLK
jgi:drug/metabolite transporter (DMT)-like permease